MSAHQGQRVLVVGGTAGIGMESARQMIAGGARAVVVGRSPARGAAAAEELGAQYLRCDAADPAQCQSMVAEAAEMLGGIDVLVSCGGGEPMPRLLRDTPPEQVMTDLMGTLAPVVQPMRAVLPVMERQEAGAIVAVASDAGKLATPGEVAIGAAMAGIIQFCRAMAIEAKRNGIRVNCVTPSIVRGTPLYDRLMDDPFAGRLFAKAEAMAHLGVAERGDVAAMIAFLASPLASKVTGQAVSVTGGISAL